jgi:hypothetical protein
MVSKNYKIITFRMKWHGQFQNPMPTHKKDSGSQARMAHTCHLATWKAEIGRILVQSQPEQIVLETLSPK